MRMLTKNYKTNVLNLNEDGKYGYSWLNISLYKNMLHVLPIDSVSVRKNSSWILHLLAIALLMDLFYNDVKMIQEI